MNNSEMLNIPPHWKTAELSEVCKLKNGFAFSSKLYIDKGIPVIRISDIYSGIVSSKNSVHVDQSSDYENYLVEEGDILVAMSGATTGKFGIFKSNEIAYQNQRVGKFQILNKSVLSNLFLFYQIFALKRLIEKDAYGGAQPNISSTKIESMNIVLPPLPEQHLIVAKIEELFSELDNAVENLKKAKEQLKVYRQAVLKWAFEGKLTEEWRKERESQNTEYQSEKEEVRVAAEEVVNYNSIVKLPPEWKKIKLKNVALKITDGEHFRPKTQSTGIPFLSAKDVREHGVSFEEPLFISKEAALKALQRCNPQKGDILIVSRGATVDRKCIVNTDRTFCLLGSVILMKIRDQFYNKYIYYALKTPLINQDIIAISGSTAQQAIYLRDIKDVEIPITSIAEQNKIVEEIETRFSVADKLEQSIDQSLQQAEALRQSILKRAFEGKLVSTHALPSLEGPGVGIPLLGGAGGGSIININKQIL